MTCKAKQRGRQRRCPRRARITATFPRARLDLVKPFRRKKLAIGTKLTIEIAAPGRIGKVVTLTMRKRALPRTRTLCRPPGGRAGACA